MNSQHSKCYADRLNSNSGPNINDLLYNIRGVHHVDTTSQFLYEVDQVYRNTHGNYYMIEQAMMQSDDYEAKKNRKIKVIRCEPYANNLVIELMKNFDIEYRIDNSPLFHVEQAQMY
jgi:hypothetical protein